MSLDKKKKKYVYSFPENKQFKKYLLRGDIRLIAVSVGLSPTHVANILRGFRRMPKKVKDMILKFGKINNLKAKLSPVDAN